MRPLAVQLVPWRRAWGSPLCAWRRFTATWDSDSPRDIQLTTYSCVLAFQSLPNNSHVERPDVPTRARKWMNCRPRQNVWIGKPLPRVHENSHAPHLASCFGSLAFLCCSSRRIFHGLFPDFLCSLHFFQGLSECPEVKSWLRFMMWAGGPQWPATGKRAKMQWLELIANSICPSVGSWCSRMLMSDICYWAHTFSDQVGMSSVSAFVNRLHVPKQHLLLSFEHWCLCWSFAADYSESKIGDVQA